MAMTAPPLGIDPRMYRHFAAITLVISACVAMFADGSHQDEKVVAPAPSATATDKPPSDGKPKREPALIDARQSAPSGWGSEGDGMPGPDDAGGDGQGSVAPSTGPQSTAIQIEIDPAASARMTPQQRAEAMKQLEQEKKRREAQGPYRPSAMELRSLRSASALRSGSEGAD